MIEFILGNFLFLNSFYEFANITSNIYKKISTEVKKISVDITKNIEKNKTKQKKIDGIYYLYVLDYDVDNYSVFQLLCDKIWKTDEKKFVLKNEKNVKYILKTCIKDFGIDRNYKEYLKNIIFKKTENINLINDISTVNLLNLYKIYKGKGEIVKNSGGFYIQNETNIIKRNLRFYDFHKEMLKANYEFVNKMNGFLEKNKIKQNIYDGWKNNKVVNSKGDGIKCGVYTTTQFLFLLDFYSTYFKVFDYGENIWTKNNYKELFEIAENDLYEINKRNGYYGLLDSDFYYIINNVGYGNSKFFLKAYINEKKDFWGFFELPVGSEYTHSVFGINTTNGWYYYIPDKGKYFSEKEIKDGIEFNGKKYNTITPAVGIYIN